MGCFEVCKTCLHTYKQQIEPSQTDGNCLFQPIKIKVVATWATGGRVLTPSSCPGVAVSLLGVLWCRGRNPVEAGSGWWWQQVRPAPLATAVQVAIKCYASATDFHNEHDFYAAQFSVSSTSEAVVPRAVIGMA